MDALDTEPPSQELSDDEFDNKEDENFRFENPKKLSREKRVERRAILTLSNWYASCILKK